MTPDAAEQTGSSLIAAVQVTREQRIEPDWDPVIGTASEIVLIQISMAGQDGT